MFVSGRLREYLDGLRRLRALEARRDLPGPRRRGDRPGGQARSVPRASRRARAQAAGGVGGRAPRARTRCSTPPGRTRPRRFARSRRSRCARTSRSSARKADFRCAEGPLGVSAPDMRKLLVGGGTLAAAGIVLAVVLLAASGGNSLAEAADRLEGQNVRVALSMGFSEDGEDAAMNGTAIMNADGTRMRMDVTTTYERRESAGQADRAGRRRRHVVHRTKASRSSYPTAAPGSTAWIARAPPTR